MDERAFLAEVARSLHWGYTSYWNGAPGKWRDVPTDEVKLWIRLARRVTTKIDELKKSSDESTEPA